jgi:hypothetical protein
MQSAGTALVQKSITRQTEMMQPVAQRRVQHAHSVSNATTEIDRRGLAKIVRRTRNFANSELEMNSLHQPLVVEDKIVRRRASTVRFRARYPVWNSESFCPPGFSEPTSMHDSRHICTAAFRSPGRRCPKCGNRARHRIPRTRSSTPWRRAAQTVRPRTPPPWPWKRRESGLGCVGSIVLRSLRRARPRSRPEELPGMH